MEFSHQAIDLGMSGTPRSPCEGGGWNPLNCSILSLCCRDSPHVLFVGLPVAHGTHGPSSNTAAASSSLPHTSSGGPLPRHFAGRGTNSGGSCMQKNNVALNMEKHDCGRNMEAEKREGGGTYELPVWCLFARRTITALLR